ncbi:MAG TPA: GvpL/GvpF family gas vesicle protein [Gemmatimonadaceae bacterium]|nr:GvpL/GvpF family gas vesicle protein [Gemmatimonadaceae bacterium]
MALNLFGVVFSDHGVAPVAGTELIAVRDLAAIVAESPYATVEPDDERVMRVAEVIGAYQARSAVLPAPIGVVFRARESVLRWLELHYVALSDALSFVDDRVVGRVHVWRPGAPEDRDAGSDLAAAAAESLRVLRRSAVATVPLRLEKITGIVLSAAFLVEQELWKEFSAKVEDQRAASPNLEFELTGPWPPYDFVHMQFGG